MTLPPITEPLDPRVAPLVTMLRAAGFATLASGDGSHEENIHRLPYVILANKSDAYGTWRIDQTRRALLRWLRERGIIANVSQVYGTIDDERFPYVRLEVYGDLPQEVGS